MSGLHNENAFFLSTAPPSLSFWGAKKKVGVESPQGMPCTPGWSTGPRRAAEVVGPYGGSAGSAQERAEIVCFFRQGFAFALVSTAGQCYTIDDLRDRPLRGPRIAALAAEERNDPHAANEAVPE